MYELMMMITLNFIIAGVPYDGEPLLEIVTVHPILTVFVIALTAMGAIFGIACMIFNFVYRNRRLVGSHIK